MSETPLTAEALAPYLKVIEDLVEPTLRPFNAWCAAYDARVARRERLAAEPTRGQRIRRAYRRRQT